MTRPFTCRCGHTRPNHQPADRWSPEVCNLCSVCSRPSHEHYGGGGHSYTPCQCWRDDPAGDDVKAVPEAATAIEEVPQVSSIQTAVENRPGTYTCRCGAHWGGLSTGHCSACHRTFTGITAFDKHRSGSHTEGRFCLDPETVGLVDAGRAYPCWGFPGGSDRWSDDEVAADGQEKP